jgi:hypothetical protein
LPQPKKKRSPRKEAVAAEIAQQKEEAFRSLEGQVALFPVKFSKNSSPRTRSLNPSPWLITVISEKIELSRQELED